MNEIIHELRNQLAIAVANVEAFIDAKLEPTPRRLRSVSDALTGIDGLLNELAQRRLQSIPDEEHIHEICAIVSNEVVALSTASARERIKLAIHRVDSDRIESDRIGQVVHDLLLNAIRHTPPGGAIVVDCHRDRDTFEFSVSSEGLGIESQHDPKAQGGAITIVSRPGDGATFTVRLLEHQPQATPKSLAS